MYLYETLKENLPIANESWKSPISGGLSKMIACSLFFPIVSMKMRLQQEQFKDTIMLKTKQIHAPIKTNMVYKGIIDCIKET